MYTIALLSPILSLSRVVLVSWYLLLASRGTEHSN